MSSSDGRPRRTVARCWRRVRTFAVPCILAWLAVAGHAQARFTTGIDDNDHFVNGELTERGHWLDTTVHLKAGIVRLDLYWSSLVTGEPTDPSDPADPAYDFSDLDEAVREAATRKLRVVITFLSAPGYAQAGSAPPAATPGTWKPDPVALGALARAVAGRYSGQFGGLPHVRYFEVWNEPNIEQFMAPQYEAGQAVAVDRYRRMVDAVEKAVNSVRRDNVVIAGSLAPYGDEPGATRTRPLVFLRKLFCLNRQLESTGCSSKPKFDILSHHPINLAGGPRKSALDPDDVSSPDLENVQRVLRAAERAKTIAGERSRHPLWVTEYWWESYPDGPDPAQPALRKHARWIQEALYLFWEAGAKVAIYFTLQDSPLQEPDGTLQAGLFDENGAPKPAATAFRFPFVTDRRSGRQVFAWGKSPSGGKLRIERLREGDWHLIHSEKVKSGAVFTAQLALRGKAKLRARVDGNHSLVWTQARGPVK